MFVYYIEASQLICAPNQFDIMNDIFKLRENTYNLRNFQKSSRKKILVHWNTDSMPFYIALADFGNKALLISVRQLL